MSGVPWSPSQAVKVREHLLACQHGPVAERAFDEVDRDALQYLIEKADAAVQVALEDAGIKAGVA